MTQMKWRIEFDFADLYFRIYQYFRIDQYFGIYLVVFKLRFFIHWYGVKGGLKAFVL